MIYVLSENIYGYGGEEQEIDRAIVKWAIVSGCARVCSGSLAACQNNCGKNRRIWGQRRERENIQTEFYRISRRFFSLGKKVYLCVGPSSNQPISHEWQLEMCSVCARYIVQGLVLLFSSLPFFFITQYSFFDIDRSSSWYEWWTISNHIVGGRSHNEAHKSRASHDTKSER